MIESHNNFEKENNEVIKKMKRKVIIVCIIAILLLVIRPILIAYLCSNLRLEPSAFSLKNDIVVYLLSCMLLWVYAILKIVLEIINRQLLKKGTKSEDTFIEHNSSEIEESAIDYSRKLKVNIVFGKIFSVFEVIFLGIAFYITFSPILHIWIGSFLFDAYM